MKKLLPLALFGLLMPALAFAGPITTLYVLGDSLSDQGNAFRLTAGAFPPLPYAQRASNGPVAVEQLASRLGVSLLPSEAGGTNFAVIGATTGPITVPSPVGPIVTENVSALRYRLPVLEGTGILSQVQELLLRGPITDPAGSLFVVWGGANDILLDSSVPSVARAAQNLSTAITQLYLGGARRFFVPNLPDLSKTPSSLALTPAERAGLQQLTIGFNQGLALALGGLSSLPGIDITPFNTFNFFNGIIANPGAFGLTNASDPCLTGVVLVGGTVCPAPNSYLFWDGLHPTAAGQRLLGDAFAATLAPADAAVPEPATLTLLCLGGGLLAVTRRKRANASRARLVDTAAPVNGPCR